MATTVRTTISVPREVKERMDATEGVNWSAVATQAFEKKLLDLESKKEVTTVEQAVARLKAAAMAEANELFQAGEEAGRAWAMTQARPRELRRLAKVPGLVLVLEKPEAGEEEKHDPAVLLYRLLHEHIESSEETLWAFWESVLGEGRGRTINDRDFATGFVGAVMEFWDSVKSQIT